MNAFQSRIHAAFLAGGAAGMARVWEYICQNPGCGVVEAGGRGGVNSLRILKLERAGLITTTFKGRKRHCYAREAP